MGKRLVRINVYCLIEDASRFCEGCEHLREIDCIGKCDIYPDGIPERLWDSDFWNSEFHAKQGSLNYLDYCIHYKKRKGEIEFE